MIFHVAHISDSHLSRDRPFFNDNFALVAAALVASSPDLVVNTGDVSLDGVANDGDLAEARRLHDAISLPVRFIPGNHDIGESADVPHTAQTVISAGSRERYLARFGDEFWLLDIPGWRFIAINAQLLGSGLEAAAAQMDFVTGAVATSNGRHIALFVHKPLFDASPEETVVAGRFVNPAARHQLLGVFAQSKLALVCSGHVHQYRSTYAGATTHIWAPSTGFIIPDARQPRYGEKEVGYVEHLFGADGTHDSRLVRIPGMKRLDITEFAAAYPGKL